MSNLKYKVGDRFKDNHNDSLEIEILQCVENDMNPYRVKYSNQFDEDYVCDIIIDKYYTKIEETKQIVGFSDMLNSFSEFLNEKDKRYGNAALQPLEILSKHHPYGARIDEKLSRILNSTELRKNDLVDLIGGLFLICRDKGWNDFKDQID
jgi:hypothetical protein